MTDRKQPLRKKGYIKINKGQPRLVMPTAKELPALPPLPVDLDAKKASEEARERIQSHLEALNNPKALKDAKSKAVKETAKALFLAARSDIPSESILVQNALNNWAVFQAFQDRFIQEAVASGPSTKEGMMFLRMAMEINKRVERESVRGVSFSGQLSFTNKNTEQKTVLDAIADTVKARLNGEEKGS